MNLQESITFMAISLLVVEIFLLLFVLHLWLFRTAEFFEYAFPKKKPTWSLFWSRDPHVSNMLVIYYSFRLFCWCATPLLVLATLKTLRFI